MLDEQYQKPLNKAELTQRQGWFTELLQGLDEAAAYIQKLQQQGEPATNNITDIVEFMREHLDLLRVEAQELNIVFMRLIQLLERIERQRDDAVAQRDDAMLTRQDAYLEGLLTHEEERLDWDWNGFGVTDTFGLQWLQDMFKKLDEHEVADKLGWFEKVFDRILELSRQHLQRSRREHDQVDD